MRNGVIIFEIFVAAIIFAPTAFSVPSEVQVEHLHILLSYSKATQKNHQSSKSEVQETWADACNSTGTSLTAGSGPYGLGIVDTFDCSNWAQKHTSKPHSWVMKVNVGAKHTTLSLFVDKEPAAKTPKPLSTYTITTGKYPLKILANSEFSDMIALALLDQLPMVLKLGPNTYDRKSNSILGRTDNRQREFPLPPPPKKLVLYKLRYNSGNGIWIPEAVAKARIDKTIRQKKKLHSKKAATEKIVWNINSKLRLKEGDYIYAHNQLGKKQFLDKISETISETVATLVDREASRILNSALKLSTLILGINSSGYVGLRYGMAILEGEVIGDSTVFGLVSEFRSGVLDGLKIYYDVWPEVGGVIDGEKTTFGGSRAIIGWSFGMDLNSQIVTGIDLTPKIGIWNFKSNLAVTTSEGEVEPLEFRIENAPSAELELGIESAHAEYILRGWAAKAISIANGSKQGGVETARIGADLIVEGPSMGNSTLSFLLFIFSEQVTLARSESDLETEGDDTIADIFYTQGYSGGGIAVSW